MKKTIYTLLSLLLTCVFCGRCFAQKDTLRVLSQNVLYYGNGCQGPNWKYHQYLKTITNFTNPDILGFVKLASIATSADDKAATAPIGFADSILQYALNAAFPSRYAYCPFSNAARTNNQCVLFYNKQKLGFVSIVSSYVNVTDFNTFKLYYKDPNLARTHDTTFLYITLNHDKSGKENEQVRAQQIAEEMKHIKQHFTELPNFINMGDFNVRSSEEAFYQELTATPDAHFRLYDPPFNPDHSLKYPADWEKNPNFSSYFTTSTRESDGVPNACGSGGGGKDWYDHIFLSSWIVNNTNYIHYIPHSYRTIGNDGQRFKISINNNNVHTNNSAPADVIEALYQFSNKYPIMVDLEVTTNTKGVSPKNPEIAGIATTVKEEVIIQYTDVSPDGSYLDVNFPDAMLGQEVTIDILDKNNNSQLKKKGNVKENKMHIRCKLKESGTYTVKINGVHNLILESKIEHQQ